MQGIVFYCDGGARPTNPGYAGSGIHGYIYTSDTPTKGIGLGSIIATSRGYFPKADSVELTTPKTKTKAKNKEEVTEIILSEEEILKRCSEDIVAVTAINYIDIAAPISSIATNNLAELNAVIYALEFIANTRAQFPEVRLISINSDSELTIKGINEWLPNWIRNGYRKADGSFVANHEWWQALVKLMERINEMGIELRCRWVRGHNGEVGNEKADALATMAVYKTYRRTYDPVVTLSSVDGYWKADSELHPFVQHKCVYFNSGDGYHRPGHYYMGNHGKDDDLMGCRQSDGSYSYVRLNTPENILESAISFAKGACGNTDELWVGYVTRLSAPTTRESVTINGEMSFDPMSPAHIGYRGIGSGKDPLVRMLRPPHLASRALDEVITLEGILMAWEEGSDKYCVREVTDQIYDISQETDKAGEVITKHAIKASLPVGVASVTLPVNYRLSAGGTATRELKFTTGIDILTRNALRRLEEFNPRIYVVTWSGGESTFRYATIVKTDDAVGIWGGVYSNLVVIDKKKK